MESAAPRLQRSPVAVRLKTYPLAGPLSATPASLLRAGQTAQPPETVGLSNQTNAPTAGPEYAEATPQMAY